MNKTVNGISTFILLFKVIFHIHTQLLEVIFYIKVINKVLTSQIFLIFQFFVVFFLNKQIEVLLFHFYLFTNFQHFNNAENNNHKKKKPH